MKKVLFVCEQNAGRSQMAEAFFNRHAPDDVRAESAGRQPRTEGVWPNVIEAMREVGLDISHKKPVKLMREMQLHADWAVTLACGAQCPYVPTTVEDWDVPDPAGESLDAVRGIRDAIEDRVRDLVENRLDAVRADRTAHELRLERLLSGLAEEFAGVRSAGEVRACADAVLAAYAEVPVRSFVMPLAQRKARERLRAKKGDALPV